MGTSNLKVEKLSQMKAILWSNNKDIRLIDLPLQSPRPGEILVKVMACGICGSDVVEWYRLPRAPLIPGHEIGAQVVEVGEKVSRFKPGDRVFIAPKVPCGKCFYCRHGHFPQCSEIKERLPGGLAEYILVPEIIVNRGTYLLPENLSYEESTFIEPLACVIRSQHLAKLKSGQIVLILGSGVSGLLHLQLAKRKKCWVINTDIVEKKLSLAKEMGADFTLLATDNISEKIQEKFGKKADLVILCTSSLSAIEQAWMSVDKGGTIVFFAVPGPEKKVFIPLNFFWTQEIKILTSYYCGPLEIEEAMKLLKERKIEVNRLISHRLPLDQTAQGYQLVLEGREALKIIIKPHFE
ncbi:MAG: alcohol dehydrogenase catalytic domain-containing protein [Candidatus Aminicenantes bacterium]|nr:alcohol dehydrogenase catalytic domain-containing protein [Candidatus Aminicenantes bacterium]